MSRDGDVAAAGCAVMVVLLMLPLCYSASLFGPTIFMAPDDLWISHWAWKVLAVFLWAWTAFGTMILFLKGQYETVLWSIIGQAVALLIGFGLTSVFL